MNPYHNYNNGYAPKHHSSQTRPRFVAYTPVPPKPSFVLSSAANRPTKFRPSVSTQTSAANRPVPPKSATLQSNAANRPTMFRPSITPQTSAANIPVPPKPATLQSNVANRPTTFRPSITNTLVLQKPAFVQNSVGNRPTTFRPSIISQTSEANTPVSQKPVFVQSNAANVQTMFGSSITSQTSAANTPVPLKPATLQSNAANRPTTFTPSINPQTSAANIPAPPKPATLQSNVANRPTTFRPPITSQTSVANTPVPQKPATLQSIASNTTGPSKYFFLPFEGKKVETSQRNVSSAIESRNSADLAPDVSLTVVDKVVSTTQHSHLSGPSTSNGGYSAPGPSGIHNNQQTVNGLTKREPDHNNDVDSSNDEMNVGSIEADAATYVNSSLDYPLPQPIPENNLYSSVYGMLTCFACGIWMSDGQIKWCACKTMCLSCASPLRKCEDCNYKFKRDMWLVKFHQRIANQIERPCKFRREGCGVVMKPGDEHESDCAYEPVACDRCGQYVSKIQMLFHLDEVHYLRSKALDVKFTDFYMAETGVRKVKCVASQGIEVYISLLNVDGGDFNQFTVVYPVTDSNVSVKLDFNWNGYLCSRINVKPPTNAEGTIPMSFIDVEKNVFDDWVQGKSKLDIEVPVRKKRQLTHVKETRIKKAKTVKKGKVKKDKRMDKIMKFLRSEHKQKIRDEYIKEACNAASRKEC